VVGNTSGATGVVIGDVTLTSGSWSNVTGAGEVVVTAVTGTFVNGETIKVATVVAATIRALRSRARSMTPTSK
jgi:hypothetical protein